MSCGESLVSGIPQYVQQWPEEPPLGDEPFVMSQRGSKINGKSKIILS